MSVVRCAKCQNPETWTYEHCPEPGCPERPASGQRDGDVYCAVCQHVDFAHADRRGCARTDCTCERVNMGYGWLDDVDGVAPAEIVRQREQHWPDFHPEDYCHRCGRPNPTWFADTAEWQTATGSTGDGGGILCPSCFCAQWEQTTGRTAIIWRLSIDPRSRDASAEPAEPTVDGLVELEALRAVVARVEAVASELDRKGDDLWAAYKTASPSDPRRANPLVEGQVDAFDEAYELLRRALDGTG